MAGWAAGIQAAGSIGGAGIAAISQHNANAKNVQLARENRDWEERMSNTAWQRGVNDMVKAGINPMLATSSGPASTPSNSAATVQPVDALGKGVSSAASVGAQGLALKQQEANIQATLANAYKTTQEGESAKWYAANAQLAANYDMNLKRQGVLAKMQEMDLTDAQIRQINEMLPYLKNASDWGAKLNQQLTHSAESQGKLLDLQIPEAKATADWFTTMGPADKAAGFAGKAANLGKGIYEAIRQLMRDSK